MKILTFWNKLNLRGQLVLATILACAIPLALVSYFGSANAKSSLRNQAFNQLESIREVKKSQIEGYFSQIRDQVLTLSESQMTVDAMKAFKPAFNNLPYQVDASESALNSYRSQAQDFYRNEFGGEYQARNGDSIVVDALVPETGSALIAQQHYIFGNSYGLGAKDSLDAASDGSDYSRAHAEFHNNFRSYLHKFEYYDIFLVEPVNGDIVYSVFKEVDYGTSLNYGPYRDTNFAEVFRSALELGPGDHYEIVDFAPYRPSYDGAASFIASPIYDQGVLEGVLVFQMPVGRIDTIMQERSGLGESGETYLVGADKLMRSQSRFSDTASILTTEVDTNATTAVISGESDIRVIDDYRGVPVLSAFTPLDIAGLQWGLIAEIDEAEALQSVSALVQRFLFWSFIGLLMAGAMAFLVARSILGKLGADPSRLQEVVKAVAENDLSMDLDIGRPATGVYADVQVMQANLRQRVESDRERMERNGRIRQALDNVDGNVMIADNDMQIIYMNTSMQPMFVAAQTEIQQAIPGFDPRALMDSSIEPFLSGSRAQSMIQSLTDSHKEDLRFGGATFSVIFNPVFGEEGERLGTVMEWMDRTQVLIAEQEVQTVVDLALEGDLSSRIELSGKEGFIQTLSSSVNQLMGIAERVVEDTTRVISAMSRGDLSETIESEYQGSFNQLKLDANATVAKLTEVVGNIQGVSSLVRSGASEISQGNTNLSHRTEEQASRLEQTSSSMEEMTSTVRQNADNAAQANQLAKAAREQAEKGGEVVGDAVNAMDEINASSKKISDIIGVIDEIAFQTNLLALNASVEAARAGEQGRGFAVVASEVRNLAGRSATAAKEIKDLIEDSERKVNEGSRLVNQSGETLDEIVSGVKKVTDIVGEIAAASQEQSQGIEEVSKAVMQMDELTQQNAALVEEAAAASESLGEQADELNDAMSFFNNKGGKHASAAATQNKYGPGGIERRSADRPWNNQAEQKPVMDSEPAPAPAKVAVSGGVSADDQDWEEF